MFRVSFVLVIFNIQIKLIDIFLTFLFFISVGLSNNFLDLCSEVIDLLKRAIVSIGDGSFFGISANIVLGVVGFGEIILRTVILGFLLINSKDRLLIFEDV